VLACQSLEPRAWCHVWTIIGLPIMQKPTQRMRPYKREAARVPYSRTYRHGSHVRRRCHLLPQGPEAVKSYLREAHDLDFDALELDTCRVVLEPNEELQLVEDVQKVQNWRCMA
jgi:hypothetical protein